jgi:predicted nucleic acid-binding protein
MNAPKRLVLDANILLRGVLGVKVRSFLNSYGDDVAFFSPEVCFQDARRHLPRFANRRGFEPTDHLAFLDEIARIVEVVDRSLYEEFELPAKARISARDPSDWPIVATALMLNAPIWTEDRDFFGSGIATWTTDRIEIFLRDA